MSDKITVKLCNERDHLSLLRGNWTSNLFYCSDTLIDQVDQLMNELPTFELDGNSTFLDLAHLIWNEELLVEEKISELGYKAEQGGTLYRHFYCYEYRRTQIPLFMCLKELYFDGPLIIVFSESWVSPHKPSPRVRKAYTRRTYLDRPDPPGFAVSSLSYVSNPSTVFIYNSEKEQSFYDVLKEKYKRAKSDPSPGMRFLVLAKENFRWRTEFLEYWAARVENNREFQAYRLLGFTSWMPYNIAELQKMLPNIINPEKLPCLLKFNDLDKDFVLVEFPSLLRINQVFEAFHKADTEALREIHEKKSALRLWKEEVTRPKTSKNESSSGSLARKEDAMAALRKRKQQEKAGEVPRKAPYPEVEKPFAIREEVLESFDYYREKFEAAYPAFLEEVLNDDKNH